MDFKADFLFSLMYFIGIVCVYITKTFHNIMVIIVIHNAIISDIKILYWDSGLLKAENWYQ